MTDLNHPWLQFLAANGARLDDGQTGEVLGFDSINTDATDPAQGYAVPLTELGLIEATGADAAGFLHNQLTNDIEHLDAAHARRAGYCTPKGRLLATFLVWRTADAIMLQLPRALQPAVQKRLQIFVLRAKARLADAGADQVAIGLGGKRAAEALAPWFATPPDAPLAKIDNEAGTLIRQPDAFGQPRWMWIAPLALAQQAWPALSASLAPSPAHVWRRADIEAGVPQVVAQTQELFVPQMINFELVDGVSFKKGCYPGQEIVARSQYLGKQKRRMLPARVASDSVAPGMELFASADPGQPCGMVVNAAPAPSGGAELLVEIKLAAREEGSVHLGAADGPALEFLPLPYPLPQ
ncbi:MAG TPA: folate-binding protein [Noviherbaspirillum sp.]|nr:folate-binding protein [Noviherbaspirillum sp.]